MSALRPSQALTVKEDLLVIEASQLMAAKRSDCVLVVDEEDHLSGIFTVSSVSGQKLDFYLNLFAARQRIWLIG